MKKILRISTIFLLCLSPLFLAQLLLLTDEYYLLSGFLSSKEKKILINNIIKEKYIDSESILLSSCKDHFDSTTKYKFSVLLLLYYGRYHKDVSLYKNYSSDIYKFSLSKKLLSYYLHSDSSLSIEKLLDQESLKRIKRKEEKLPLDSSFWKIIDYHWNSNLNKNQTYCDLVLNLFSTSPSKFKLYKINGKIDEPIAGKVDLSNINSEAKKKYIEKNMIISSADDSAFDEELGSLTNYLYKGEFGQLFNLSIRLKAFFNKNKKVTIKQGQNLKRIELASLVAKSIRSKFEHLNPSLANNDNNAKEILIEDKHKKNRKVDYIGIKIYFLSKSFFEYDYQALLKKESKLNYNINLAENVIKEYKKSDNNEEKIQEKLKELDDFKSAIEYEKDYYVNLQLREYTKEIEHSAYVNKLDLNKIKISHKPRNLKNEGHENLEFEIEFNYTPATNSPYIDKIHKDVANTIIRSMEDYLKFRRVDYQKLNYAINIEIKIL
ncbi:MAG: hypothetical protein SFU99_23435 [Saprospiraceae bacterium]|nr:hypothetical protein [Saprospiraceae bacterium]